MKRSKASSKPILTLNGEGCLMPLVISFYRRGTPMLNLLIIIAAVFLGALGTTKAWALALRHLHATEIPAYVENTLPLSTEAYHATILRIREDAAGIGVCVNLANGLLAGILAALVLLLLR
jgi:hypothetical protein